MFSTSIRINPGKTKIWNAVGVKPSGCGVLQRIAEYVRSHSGGVERIQVAHAQGLNVLGTPLGHPDFVRTQFGDEEHFLPLFLGQDPPFGRRASFLVVIGPLCSCTS